MHGYAFTISIAPYNLNLEFNIFTSSNFMNVLCKSLMCHKIFICCEFLEHFAFLMLTTAVIVKSYQIVVCAKTDITNWNDNWIENAGNRLNLVTFSINTNGTACEKFKIEMK